MNSSTVSTTSETDTSERRVGLGEGRHGRELGREMWLQLLKMYECMPITLFFMQPNPTLIPLDLTGQLRQKVRICVQKK